MQIVPRILHFERCSIVFTVREICREQWIRYLREHCSARRAKQIDLPCSPSVAKRKTPFPLTNEHAASPCSFFNSENTFSHIPSRIRVRYIHLTRHFSPLTRMRFMRVRACDKEGLEPRLGTAMMQSPSCSSLGRPVRE